ncbi:MAG: single-stranded DNA-binding protein [Clostridiales bacterium]|nr:single-stranded DNA-binding protein [Clostridiales bacterium]
MNKIILVGNLTRDPDLRTTSTGISVCSFTIAVNKRKSGQDSQPEADFFRITAWRQLGELCQRYLSKGRKVAVVGSVSVSTYEGKDGTTKASLEVTADEVEFLSPRQEQEAQGQANSGFTEIEEDELPF